MGNFGLNQLRGFLPKAQRFKDLLGAFPQDPFLACWHDDNDPLHRGEVASAVRCTVGENIFARRSTHTALNRYLDGAINIIFGGSARFDVGVPLLDLHRGGAIQRDDRWRSVRDCLAVVDRILTR